MEARHSQGSQGVQLNNEQSRPPLQTTFFSPMFYCAVCLPLTFYPGRYLSTIWPCAFLQGACLRSLRQCTSRAVDLCSDKATSAMVNSRREAFGQFAQASKPRQMCKLGHSTFCRQSLVCIKSVVGCHLACGLIKASICLKPNDDQVELSVMAVKATTT